MTAVRSIAARRAANLSGPLRASRNSVSDGVNSVVSNALASDGSVFLDISGTRRDFMPEAFYDHMLKCGLDIDRDTKARVAGILQRTNLPSTLAPGEYVVSASPAGGIHLINWPKGKLKTAQRAELEDAVRPMLFDLAADLCHQLRTNWPSEDALRSEIAELKTAISPPAA